MRLEEVIVRSTSYPHREARQYDSLFARWFALYAFICSLTFDHQLRPVVLLIAALFAGGISWAILFFEFAFIRKLIAGHRAKARLYIYDQVSAGMKDFETASICPLTKSWHNLGPPVHFRSAITRAGNKYRVQYYQRLDEEFEAYLIEVPRPLLLRFIYSRFFVLPKDELEKATGLAS